MESRELRREREQNWEELEGLVDRIEADGIDALSYREIRKLCTLYRMTVSSYSVIKELSLDRNLHQYLHNLITRAYLIIYHYDFSPDVDAVGFFRRDFPALVRKHATKLIVSILVLACSIGLSLFLTSRDRQYADLFIPASLAEGRTSSASTDELKDSLYSGRESGSGSRAVFSAYLFQHNAKVGILSFSIGMVGGIPALAINAYNGLMLGSMAGLYHSHGIGYPFWGWVLPHGVTELLAVLLCVQAGLIVGITVVFPGAYRWRDAVARAGREAGQIVLGTLPMFLVAGLIEGVLRQTDLGWEERYVFAALTAVLWGGYFLFAGRVSGMEENRDDTVEALHDL